MVSDQDNTQSTALHLAVENQSFEVAKICIEKSKAFSKLSVTDICSCDEATPLCRLVWGF